MYEGPSREEIEENEYIQALKELLNKIEESQVLSGEALDMVKKLLEHDN